MKKTILTTVVFSAIAAFFTYYWTSRNCPEKIIEVEPKNSICLNYDEPLNYLSKDLISNMVTDYRNNKALYFNHRMNIKDAHSIWFDLETLKKFIFQIEINAKRNNFNVSGEENNLGIRIYYADYPKKEDWANSRGRFHKELFNFLNSNDYTRQYSRLHTLIMIPTRRFELVGGKIKNVDIDISDPLSFSAGYKEMTKIYEHLNDSIPVLLDYHNYDEKQSAQNHGSMIPPMDPDGQESF